MAILRPKARIIRTIGDQLISGPEAAIIELVKNAYDADAKRVNVEFSYSSVSGLSLVVKDDGHGMTFEDITGSWLEPATDIKVKNRKSRSGQRIVLGAKGIGRFAVARLGQLSLMNSVSKRTYDNYFEKSAILIDWNQFDSDRYLDDIEIDIQREQANPDEMPGVSIEITKLRDSWTKSQIEKLIIELRRLSQPSESDKFNIYLNLECFTVSDHGFNGKDILFENNQNLDSSDPNDSDSSLIKSFAMGSIADYIVEGDFEEDGKFTGFFQIMKGDGVKQDLYIPPSQPASDEKACGRIEVKLNIFDREQESIEKLFERTNIKFEKIGIRRARRILTDLSGISIIRNNFRIRPYGSPDHDWLGLQAKRVQDPSKKLGSDQLSGYVAIQDEMVSGIIERSSREGLELNEHFSRLRSLLEQLLPHIEERRFEFREKAGLSRRPATNLDRARKAANFTQTSKAVDKLPPELRIKIEKAIEKDSESLNQMLDEVDSYQKLLQSRASLGLVVAEVIHEGRRQLSPMMTSIKSLKNDWIHAFEDSRIGELYREQFPSNLDIIQSAGSGLSRLFKQLDPVSGRRRGHPTNINIKEVVNNALDSFRQSISSNLIHTETNIPNDLMFFGFREDLQGGALNILENAIHWLKISNSDSRRLTIAAKSNEEKVIISFSNNGQSIDDSYKDRIFDAGFSLKSDGTGLGLAIAREACRASKGELSLDDSTDETTFIITLPKGP
ncbi:MAG: sensor histidine kinase [Pseudohongiella sp.]|nr:sensor histidine kinase [Pseudohongiella sp.]